MKNLYTHILGCKVNYADLQAVVERLPDHGGGQLALVGTCCVTAEGEKQSRKQVRRAIRRVGPGGRVFVTGCAARLSPGVFAGLAENVRVVTGEPEEIAADIQRELSGGSHLSAKAMDHYPPQVPERRTRFFLKVQDGCANRCSYCVIPEVRGKPRSIAALEVLATAKKMVQAGYPELVVSGINAGIWRDGDLELAGLMERLAQTEGLARLRLSSIEATRVTGELLEVISGNSRIGRHLHLPLQSGDDRVLAAMGRRYDTTAFREAVELARKKLPGVNLTTDVIVGFPGEDEAAFTNTVRYVEETGFSRLHVFSYSPRPGTAAARLGDSVSPSEKKRRSGILRDLSARLQFAHRQRKVGLTGEILLESRLSPGVHGGYSSDYTRYVVEGHEAGELVRVRAREILAEGVRGEVIEA
ncbi:MAG: MiaB/RimO family radical SAM methylthiotransferase [Thermoleophilia bacterium]